MQFVKVIEARNRICAEERCIDCPLSRNYSGYNLDCNSLIFYHPQTAETIIKFWLKDHKEEEPTND